MITDVLAARAPEVETLRRRSGRRDWVWPVGLALTVIAFAVYSVLFFYLYPTAGDNVRVSAILPGMVAAVVLGFRATLITSLITSFISAPIYIAIVTEQSLWTVYREQLIGIASNLIVPLIIAHFRDMYVKVFRLSHEIKRIHALDDLTGIYNRRSLFALGEQLIKRAQRQHKDAKYYLGTQWRQPSRSAGEHEADDAFLPAAFALVDIDAFKNINDSYGHQGGDAVLRQVGEALAAVADDWDSAVVGRYGGEEFLVMLPDISVTRASDILTRLMTRVRQLRICRPGAPVIEHLSISVGMTMLRPEDTDMEALIQRADRRLYLAKNSGRDCLVTADAD